MTHRRTGEYQGFSMVEIMIALGIVGIMSATGVGLVVQNIEKGRVATAREDTRAIFRAVESFHANVTFYPGEKETTKNYMHSSTIDRRPTYKGVAASAAVGVSMANYLYNDPGASYRNWRGPYLSEDRTDPWGHSYIIYTTGIHGAGCASFAIASGTPVYAWVLSAGKDGDIDTSPADSTLHFVDGSDEDIGVISFRTKCD
ncbi:MAG: type II secretion system protein GspG [SAR324 cluster bacterium]|nr:type II secretion system protein GspG [SAR324 cluster bacterium]